MVFKLKTDFYQEIIMNMYNNLPFSIIITTFQHYMTQSKLVNTFKEIYGPHSAFALPALSKLRSPLKHVVT